MLNLMAVLLTVLSRGHNLWCGAVPSAPYSLYRWPCHVQCQWQS